MPVSVPASGMKAMMSDGTVWNLCVRDFQVTHLCPRIGPPPPAPPDAPSLHRPLPNSCACAFLQGPNQDYVLDYEITYSLVPSRPPFVLLNVAPGMKSLGFGRGHSLSPLP